MASVKSKVPKLRFKGLSGEWNITKLCDISDKVQEKNKNNLITETFTNSAEYGIINQRDFFNKDISNEVNLCHYYVVQPNDFVYNPRISNLAPVGPIQRNKLNRTGVMSPLYYVFRTYSINNDFLDYYFSTSKWHRFMFMNGDKGARSDRFAIGDSVFRTMPILTPKQQEQTQIGNFFQKLEQVIELQQHALTQAQNYKKAMLQKMFPQKGEKVPRLRFKEFRGDWEEKRLGDQGSVNSGQGFPEDKQGGKEGTPFYKVSDMNLSSNQIMMQQSNNYVSNKLILANKWKIISDVPAVIFAKVGAAVMLDRKRLVLSPFLMDNNLMSYSFSSQWYYYFGKIFFDTLFLPKLAQIGALPSMNANDIKLVSFRMPSIKEQIQIGNFFQQLDKQIAEQQNKLTYYQTLKKAMLQRLFI